MMMNNNPSESQIEEDRQNRAITSNDSLDEKISVTDTVDIRPNDVLCGRSKVSFNHAGNRRFRSVVTSSLREYDEANSKWAKSMVAAKLVGIIRAEGGRFLKQKKGKEDEWYELSTQEAKAKVSHAIRDAIAAKEKTKANKQAALTSYDEVVGFHLQKHQQLKFQQQQQQMESFGKIGGPMHFDGVSTMPPSLAMQQSPPMMNVPIPNLPSAAMNNQAMFGMGGPQNFVGISNNCFGPQMMGFVPTNTSPQFFGDNMGMGMMGNNSMMGSGMMGVGAGAAMFNNNDGMGMGGLGTSGMQQSKTMMMPRRHSQPPSSQGIRGKRLHGRNSMPSLGVHSTDVTVTRVPSLQLEPEEMKTGSEQAHTESGDGETEFLSLIDNVLGPSSGKKKPKGN